ncbi:unnamed protein product [Brugia pahangi]|uniref:Centrosomal protein n=1 Tax=Brugia pahangi TaxID=6280 RepID=A0A0N4TXW7_BRUPA|nr:unnamed protein product [Brugia pahangi]
MAPLNVNELGELFEEGSDHPEIVNRWYEQLSKCDLEDIEISESVKPIMKAMQWIMQYEHANAEELKELAVKEAAEMVEKQENWEEEKENMNLELNFLRERITATTNSTDLSETFRTRINSLTEENVYLKERNKERDRELAEQSDKAEKLNCRIEQLENERAKLIQQQMFLDDSVRELSRRLENKLEGSATNEAEALKLRQRSQQAALLSKQVQEVAQQNDELRAEIEQLSTALASATTFIEDTAHNYQSLHEQLLESDKIIERLTNDNELLGKKLENEKTTTGKLENIDENSFQHYKELLQDKDEQIEALQLKFETLQVELQELQAQNVLESNMKGDKEMEKLRAELLDATKIARQFFSGTITNNKVNTSIAQMQCKITALKEIVDNLHTEIKQREMENNELIRNIEMKDSENQKISAELKRLRGEIFGSAESEINRLEKQINFREQQIEKLTAKCSLLQIELSTAFNTSEDKLEDSVSATNSVEKFLVEEFEKRDDRSSSEVEKCTDDSANILHEMKENDVECKPNSESLLKIHKRLIKSGKKKKEYEGSLESLEASAMIISSLNHELMLLMQELDEKDRQLQCMEKSMQHAASSIDELKVNYFNLQKEVSVNDTTYHNKTIDELRQQMECYEIKIEEYQKLANSIHLNGNEMQEKVEEMNRQVIAERLRNLQLIRKLEIVERNRNNENVEYRKIEKNYQEQRLLHLKQLKIANYESDLASIEIARLQTLLLRSVPKYDYDKLLAQHKQVLTSDDNYKSIDDNFKNDQKIQRKDEQIQKLEETVNSLQKEIEDLFATTFKISDYDDGNERINKSANDEFYSNVEKEEAKIELKSNDFEDISNEREKLKMEEWKDIEIATETTNSESDVKYHATIELPETDATQKSAHIHSEEFMKKLNYISETAKLCIANYKERLKYKDEVIEKYKSLLKIVSDERNVHEITDNSSPIAKQKLRTSSEILSQNYNTDIEAKDMEIVKLRNEIEQFIKANRKLTRDLHSQNQTKDCTEISTQTDLLMISDSDNDDNDEITNGSILNEENNLSNRIDKSRQSISNEESSTVTQLHTSSLAQSIMHTAPIEVTETQNNDVVMEALRKEESKIMIMRMEIRDLKQRNAALHIRNKELEKAYESIRTEALSEIKYSYTSNINLESDAIVMR